MSDKEIKRENLRDINKANFMAIEMELQLQRKLIDDMTKKMDILQNSYSTLQNQHQQFITQYGLTMQQKLAGGPTVTSNGNNG